MDKRIIRSTYSLCPICAKRIKADIVGECCGVYMEKTCPEHGPFRTVLWRGSTPFEEWCAYEQGQTEPKLCPDACGLCAEHLQGTCCTLIEVTARCDMDCTFCFADERGEADPDIGTIRERIKALVEPGKTLLQLSGGEPTMRDDLPEIVAAAKELGCKYIQLNSNGLRLARDEEYVKALADAGLSFVFLQFDGVSDEIWTAMRGRPLFAEKKKAIEMCGRYGIGVTLVPVIVPGVNDKEIGKIIDFGASMSPYVRGVHFQPVSWFGRCPKRPEDKDRFTLGELIDAVVAQSSVKADDLAPSRCDHALCGFHGSFIAAPDGLVPLTSRSAAPAEGSCCCGVTAEQNREYVARRWVRRDAQEETCCCGEIDLTSFEGFIRASKERSFTITAMAFQDIWNVDTARLRRCSLHVFEDGRFMPFCVKYMTKADGERVYG